MVSGQTPRFSWKMEMVNEIRNNAAFVGLSVWHTALLRIAARPRFLCSFWWQAFRRAGRKHGRTVSGRCRRRRGSLSATSPWATRAGPGASAMLAARTASLCVSASRPALWTPSAPDLRLRLGKFWCCECSAGSDPGGPTACRSLAALHEASASAQLTSADPQRHAALLDTLRLCCVQECSLILWVRSASKLCAGGSTMSTCCLWLPHLRQHTQRNK